MNTIRRQFGLRGAACSKQEGKEKGENMKHHQYNPDFKFVVDPERFDKYTDRELLQ